MCGGLIDTSLNGRDPMAVSVHHIHERMFGGAVIVPVEELALTHNACNAAAGNRARARPAPYGRGRVHEQQLAIEAVQAVEASSQFSGSRGLTPPHAHGISPDLAQLSHIQRVKTPIASDLHEVDENELEGDGEFVLPRLESPPHRECVGSYGAEADAWLSCYFGIELYPFQRYVLERALEHREDGSLIHRNVVLTVPRQCGKSFLSRAVMLWRLFQAERFGEEQTILHAASNRSIAHRVWRQAARQVEAKVPDAVVRFANGQEEIELPDGSSWFVVAANHGAVGRSVSMAFVDEAFDVDTTIVTEVVAPSLLAKESPALWLVSTAGDTNSDLMRTYRQRGIEQLESDESNVLLLEWSAAPDKDTLDVDAWRQASPIWSKQRAELLADQVNLSGETAFRMQYLNQWITGSARAWISEQSWTDCSSDRELPDPILSPGVLAIERGMDDGRIIAPFGLVLAAVDENGEVIVRSWSEKDQAAAVERAQLIANERRNITILHHETVRLPLIRYAHMTKLTGYRDQKAGFGPTLNAILDARLHHADEPALTEAVLCSNTAVDPEGRRVISQRASEHPIFLCRAMIWATGEALKPLQAHKPMMVSAG